MLLKAIALEQVGKFTKFQLESGLTIQIFTGSYQFQIGEQVIIFGIPVLGDKSKPIYAVTHGSNLPFLRLTATFQEGMSKEPIGYVNAMYKSVKKGSGKVWKTETFIDLAWFDIPVSPDQIRVQALSEIVKTFKRKERYPAALIPATLGSIRQKGILFQGNANEDDATFKERLLRFLQCKPHWAPLVANNPEHRQMYKYLAQATGKWDLYHELFPALPTPTPTALSIDAGLEADAQMDAALDEAAAKEEQAIQEAEAANAAPITEQAVEAEATGNVEIVPETTQEAEITAEDLANELDEEGGENEQTDNLPKEETTEQAVQ